MTPFYVLVRATSSTHLGTEFSECVPRMRKKDNSTILMKRWCRSEISAIFRAYRTDLRNIITHRIICEWVTQEPVLIRTGRTVYTHRRRKIETNRSLMIECVKLSNVIEDWFDQTGERFKCYWFKCHVFGVCHEAVFFFSFNDWLCNRKSHKLCNRFGMSYGGLVPSRSRMWV